MPIDEDILESTISNLVDKINANSIQRTKLRELYAYAQEIALVSIPDPTPEEPSRTKKIMPIDKKLGTKITDERREAIYEKLLVDVDNLKY